MTDVRRHILRNRWLTLAEQMNETDLGALLLTNPADVRWLTGYTGSNGAALAITNGPPLLATDARYTERAAQESPEIELIVTRELIGQLLMRLRENSAQSLGVDPGSLSLAQFRLISAHPALFGVRIEEVEAPLQNLREVKDMYELESLRTACQITVDALDDVLEQIAVGQTEIEFARMLESAMGRRGAEDRAFPSIVAAGVNGASPHHAPSDRTVEPGDLVTLDFGALVDGYHADCTRTVIVGAEPEQWQEEIYQTVEQASAQAREAAVTGVPTAVIDATARTVISDAGFGEFFVHGVGHGVGLDVHEAPMMGASSSGTLAASVPFTVEPGIYLPGQGGVRIEDTCVIGEDGLEILTDYPRELRRVG